MEINKIGKFYSWEILSEKVAIKKCDKSFFDNHGTAIPKEVTWFFDADNLRQDQKQVILQYNGIKFSAKLSAQDRGDEHTPTTRLIWGIDLANELQKLKADIMGDFSGYVKFQNQGERTFKLDPIILEFEQLPRPKEEVNTDFTVPTMIDDIIEILEREVCFAQQEYDDAVRIENYKQMIEAQKLASIRISSSNRWVKSLAKIKSEMQLSGIYQLIPDNKANNFDDTPTETNEGVEIKIGQYVRERMQLLEKAMLTFTDREWSDLFDLNFSRKVFHISKPFFMLCDNTKTAREQIVDESGNNRYWSVPYMFNGKLVFLCSQWYFKNKDFFDEWATPMAKRAGIEFPDRKVVTDIGEAKRNPQRIHTIERSDNLKIIEGIHNQIRGIEKMDILFKPGYFELMQTKDWSRENLLLSTPFMKIVNTNIPLEKQQIDDNGMLAYWGNPFHFDGKEVLVCSEWSERNAGYFQKWLASIDQYVSTSDEIEANSTGDKDVVKICVTDYRLKGCYKK